MKHPTEKENQPKPIFAIELMPKIDEKLIEVLQELSPEEWLAPTVAPQWKVIDVAAHLLDGNLRTLSMLRDEYYGETPGAVDSYKDMVGYLNRLNADWVKAMKRLSPKVLIDLLASSGKEYCDYLQSLDPFATATFSVAWAGESASTNWFHIAREYTEKWHHQQQIRLAVGRSAPLLADAFYFPYLDTSVRALPYHYRNIKGQENDLIRFAFQGVSDKSWYLQWQSDQWQLLTAATATPTTEVFIPDEYAWRIFTKGMPREEAINKSLIKGNQTLGKRIFELIAVMA